MNWIDRLRRRLLTRDNAIVFCVTFTLLLGVNFALVYTAPSFAHRLPFDVVRLISPCYRSFIYTDPTRMPDRPRFEVVLGDSFAEGGGDEWLSSDPRYGLFNKLEPDDRRQFISFARSGYGAIGTVLEEQRCQRLLEQRTSLGLAREAVSHLTFVFYEGNDLNDVLMEQHRRSSAAKYNARFLLPVFDYAYRKLRSGRDDASADGPDAGVPMADYPRSASGVTLGDYPQSAAMELTEDDIDLALDALTRSLATVEARYPGRQLQFLYIPSVASSYDFRGRLKTQSYAGLPYFQTTGEVNRHRHDHLRDRVSAAVVALGWQFCDASEALRVQTSAGAPVHGPRDWQHLNKRGYAILAERYTECFGGVRPRDTPT
ncbi:MAG: hypothetical protein AAF460_02765 [Pseudomonadota bacterium]